MMPRSKCGAECRSMNVIIAGAGEVGGHAAEVLSEVGHAVTVIDLSAERLRVLGEALDVRTLPGHCAHVDVLGDSGCEKCDLFIAATDIDEINLLAATLARQLGAAKTIVRVHHTANFSLRGTPTATKLGIDELLCPEHLTSLEIARAIRNPGSIALEEFSRGQLLMQRFPVSAGAHAVGKKLSEISLPAETRVATVEGGDGPRLATAESTIRENDFITLLGRTKSFDTARKLFNKGKDRRQHVVIMGETSTAVWLCRALADRLISLRLFASLRDRAEELAGKLDHVTVLEADPTDAAVFSDEQISRADAFIAVTDDDEHNILAAAQSKALGTAQVVAVVQRTKYLHLFGHVGIDRVFSPRHVAVRSILKLIETGPVRSVTRFADGAAEVYDITPAPKAKIVGHELRYIQMPPQSMIAAIRRDGDVRVPGADDKVQHGDHLLVIGPADIHDDLRRLFVSK